MRAIYSKFTTSSQFLRRRCHLLTVYNYQAPHFSTQPKKLVEQQSQIPSKPQKQAYRIDQDEDVNPLAQFWNLKVDVYNKEQKTTTLIEKPD